VHLESFNVTEVRVGLKGIRKLAVLLQQLKAVLADSQVLLLCRGCFSSSKQVLRYNSQSDISGVDEIGRDGMWRLTMADLSA
jgi:hypothetical protein